MAAISSPGRADTIMVGLLNAEGVEFIARERARLASAVVEGAMESFFESDHIVFDLGLPSDDETVLPDPKSAARIARIGGAGYFLDMRIGPPDDETGLPDYIIYEFIDLADNRALTGGMIKKAEIKADITDPLTICALLGAAAAAEAVRILDFIYSPDSPFSPIMKQETAQ